MLTDLDTSANETLYRGAIPYVSSPMDASSIFAAKILKSAGTFLARWEGARAQLWDLQPSHKSLRIVLQQPGRAGNLTIVCLDPMVIRSPVSWENSRIVVTTVDLQEGRGTAFRIVDSRADSEILCAAIEVKENVKL